MLVAAFSVFAALLLNAQVLIIGLIQQRRGNNIDTKNVSQEDQVVISRRKKLEELATTELFANISYAIIISLFVVALTLFVVFVCIEQSLLFKSVQFFLVLHFVLTALMVLKRLHVIFGENQKS